MRARATASDVLAMPRTKRPGWIYVARALIREYPVASTYVGWNGREHQSRDYSAAPREFYGWKVGRTTNLPQRVVDLLIGCRDITLVAIAPGSNTDEFSVHRRMSGESIQTGYHGSGSHAREWYRDTPAFRSWVGRLDATWRGSIRCAMQERGGARAEFMPRVHDLWESVNDPRRGKVAHQLSLFARVA